MTNRRSTRYTRRPAGVAAFALLAACAGTFVVVHAPMALAINDPIPGVDIVVKKHPGGNAITVGNCQSGGGKVNTLDEPKDTATVTINGVSRNTTVKGSNRRTISRAKSPRGIATPMMKAPKTA